MSDQTAPDVPDFDMLRTVGSGGFGEVWLAVNRTTGRLRAVKLIPLQQSGRSDAAAREIGSLTRLEANLRCRHPNLLQIHHVGKTARHLFYVMDPADDISGAPAADRPDYRPATLQARLQNAGEEGDSPIFAANDRSQNRNVEGAAKIGTVPIPSHSPLPLGEGQGVRAPFPPELCLDYARQLLAGLAALHSAGMVHRDVKPANCLFVGGQLKLADFGLLTESHPLVSRLGTQKYMPPDGRMDMRADVYAAGLVIYEMLSGLPVDDFPRLGRRSRVIAADANLAALLRLVLRACERDPEQRFADARTMLAELSPLKQSLTSRPRRLLLSTVFVACVFAALGFGAWFLFPQQVAVSFVTEPFEAKIYLDDVLQCDDAGNACTTPCTLENLPAHTCRVAFECAGLPRWDAGSHDFAQTRQIFSRRPPK